MHRAAAAAAGMHACCPLRLPAHMVAAQPQQRTHLGIGQVVLDDLQHERRCVIREQRQVSQMLSLQFLATAQQAAAAAPIVHPLECTTHKPAVPSHACCTAPPPTCTSSGLTTNVRSERRTRANSVSRLWRTFWAAGASDSSHSSTAVGVAASTGHATVACREGTRNRRQELV